MSSKSRLPRGYVELVLMFILFSFGGCSGDPITPAKPKMCEPGETLLDDGRCQPAGLPLDMQCPPGELALENGGCQPAGLPTDMVCPPGEYEKEGGGCEPAGIPPEMCAPGFLPDGNRGCEPILPVDPCPDGMMAIPGDTVCREVMPCGVGDYGDIPVDATTQFVNAAYAGNDGNGTKAKPWKTIQAGVFAAAKGAIVAVAAGIYNEDVTIQGKAVKVWGRCPGMVEVLGTGNKPSVGIYAVKANATEVHGISITGPAKGMEVFGAVGVVVDRVRIHDTQNIGIDAMTVADATDVTITGALIERTTKIGLSPWGSTMAVEGSIVRNTKDDGSGSWGRGIHAENLGTAQANVNVHDSLIERNSYAGIVAFGAALSLEATVVKETLPGSNGSYGLGILAQKSGSRANVSVRMSVVEKNHDIGVLVISSEAMIEGTMVRGTQPNASGTAGMGIYAQGAVTSKAERSSVTINHSVVDRNRTNGILAAASDVVVTATIVRRTIADGNVGNGIASEDDLSGMHRAVLQVKDSLIHENDERGLFVAGSDAVLEGLVIRDNKGHGIEAIRTADSGQRSSVVLRTSQIERNGGVGVYVSSADIQFDSTVVRDTQPMGAEPFGFGVSVRGDVDVPAKIVMKAGLIENSLGVGVQIVGCEGWIEGSVIHGTTSGGLGLSGSGIAVHDYPKTHTAARMTVLTSLVEQNAAFGVYVTGSDVMVDETVVRENGFNPLSYGSGITFESGADVSVRTRGTVQRSIVEYNHETGIAALGAHVNIESTVVRATKVNGNGTSGSGVHVQPDRASGNLATLSVVGSVIETNRESGIYTLNSHATIESTLLSGSTANDLGEFGDGIVVASVTEFVSKWNLTPPSVTINSSHIENNARAGISNFGGNIVLTDSELVCHAFDLNGEDSAGYTWSFDGSHDNKCGCPEATGTCGAKSAGLGPPHIVYDESGETPSP